MQSETDWDDFLENFYREEWDKLNSSEKALCKNYERHLVNNMKIKPEMVLAINDIHDKYPDFHIGCMPAIKSKPMEKHVNEYRTMDFSNFLEDEPA